MTISNRANFIAIQIEIRTNNENCFNFVFYLFILGSPPHRIVKFLCNHSRGDMGFNQL